MQFEEIFEKYVKPNLLSVEQMNFWHEQIKNYLNKEDSNFYIIRRYSANGPTGRENRRGMKILINKHTKVVYCDNSFVLNAHFFFKNYRFSFEEFINKIYSKEIPIGLFSRLHESKNSNFKFGKYHEIDNKLKLAHIFSVNKNEYSYNYSQIKKVLYPIGNISDWDNTEKVYNVELKLDYKKLIISHFVRLVHPINYIFTPSILNKISEDDDFLKFIFEEKFARIYDEKIINDFLGWSLINENNKKCSNLKSHTIKIPIFTVDENQKIGNVAKSIFEKLNFENSMNDNIISDLSNVEFCKKHLKLSSNYPVLLNRINSKIKRQYYSKPLNVHGKKFYLTNQWKQNQKDVLILWYKSL